MQHRRPRAWWPAVTLCWLLGCGGDPATVDAALGDGSVADAAATDAGATDAGATDAGATDAGAVDAAVADGGRTVDAASADPDSDGAPTELELACGTDPEDRTDVPSPSELRGAGTEGDPFLLCFAEHFELFAVHPSVVRAHARVTRDLDLGSLSAPASIGDSTTAFDGVFDGGGHTLRGLRIGTADAPRPGLFAAVGSEGVIRDLRLEGAVSFSGSPLVDYMGGALRRVHVEGSVVTPHHGGVLANRSLTGARIEDCSSAGTISAGDLAAMGSHVGGLVGQNDGSILRSSSTVVVRGRNRVGGLVGSGGGVVEASFATGDVTGSGFWIGGLIGTARADGIVTDAFATGHVMAAVKGAGGLIGNVEPGVTVRRVYAIGVAVAPSLAGGVLGEDTSGGATELRDCYFDEAATASDAASCVGLSGSELTTAENFVGFDFDTVPVWKVDSSLRPSPSLAWE